MVSKVTTNQEKARILALHEEKVSIVEICRRTGRSKSTILRLISAARNLSPGEIPVHKPLPGQPRKTSKATDHLLKRAVLKNPRITAVELKSMYPSLLGKMSLRGIRNRLQKDFGLRCRQAALKPLLTKTMLKKRLAFAKKYITWTPEQWNDVMWSDESTFRVLTSHRVQVRRPSGTRYDSAYTVKTVKHSPSVMVWGCFSGKAGRGGLFFLPRNVTMNGERYMSVLDDHLLSFYEIHGTSIFMQDGAPCHTSKKVLAFLKSKKVKVLEWPGNSPDLNPIENAWKIMKNKVKNGAVTSIPTLIEKIKDVWLHDISHEYLRTLAESMPRRLAAVIKAKGDMSKY